MSENVKIRITIEVPFSYYDANREAISNYYFSRPSDDTTVLMEVVKSEEE